MKSKKASLKTENTRTFIETNLTSSASLYGAFSQRGYPALRSSNNGQHHTSATKKRRKEGTNMQCAVNVTLPAPAPTLQDKTPAFLKGE
jgi:hypothetical protein